MDGNGGTLKNCIYRDTPQQFPDHSDKTITSIIVLEKVLVESEHCTKNEVFH